MVIKCSGLDTGTHIPGSFCVSSTAAIGIPKFETGPQKSGVCRILSASRSHTVLGTAAGRTADKGTVVCPEYARVEQI